MFGQGSVTNAEDIKLINICQSKVADVVLIDRTTHTRKIPNTLAFLSRSQIFVKEIKFINSIDELNAIKKDKNYIDVYDPIADPSRVLNVPTKQGQPSEKLLNWLLEVEKKK